VPPQTVNASSPELDASLSAQLQRGCDTLELDIADEKRALLMEYLDLLCKWNKTYNLTAVRDASQMVTRHLLDSLAIAPHLRGQRCIDVGTGAGLPGVPMAILFPDTQFHLLDSNGKKTRFLFQVKTALRLDNMVIHQARVESFQDERLFDAVLSRAFASLQDMMQACRHLLAKEGRFLAMKGAYPTEELAQLRSDCAITGVYPLAVPDLGEQRHLVEFMLQQSTGQP
jgi:16S rRNA (guanine527-N7)-methyltransferase